jgi:putative ABC transport system permease protein
LDKADVGVVKIEDGADPRAVQQALRETLPDDVVVLTRDEMAELESKFWNDNSAIGYVFGLGMAVGFGIGIIICYQILYTNVISYLPQFATLKAMGYSDAYLVGVVLQQGLFLALLSFVPAIAGAQLLFWGISKATGLLMFLTVWRIALVLVLTVLMCMVSGVIAVRRVVAADPAEVFQ